MKCHMGTLRSIREHCQANLWELFRGGRQYVLRMEKATTSQKTFVRASNPHDPLTAEWYVFEMQVVKEKLAAGAIEPLDAQRSITTWVKLAEQEGLDLAAARDGQLDPIRRLLADPDLPNHTAEHLHALQDAIRKVEALNARERTVKKKWLDLIKITLDIQRRAKENPVSFTLYVVRDQDHDDVLDFEEIHVAFFEAWNDPDYLNSLQLAPPGVGKTTALYGQNLWDFAHDQTLRCLKICQDLPTAQKRLGVVRTYIDVKRFKALAPHVRIDVTQPDNSKSFTLIRKNVGSQDPSMTAAGSATTVQGAGFDRIDADDLCPEKVRREKSTRDSINDNWFNVVLERIRQRDTARIRKICTPWDPRDTAGIMIAQAKAGKLTGWRINSYPVAENAQGVPIPNVTRPGLQQHLISVKANHPRTYQFCHRLNPTPTELRLLKQVKYWDSEGGTSPLCPENKREWWAKFKRAVDAGEKWQVFDPAAGGADHTFSVGFSISGSGRAAITNAQYWNVNADESIPKLLQLVQERHADNVLIESAGPMKGVADIWKSMLVAALGEHFEDRVWFSGTRLRDVHGQEVGANVNKQARFSNASPYLSSGAIVFPGKWTKTESGVELQCTDDADLRYLHEQLMTYPNCVRDDGIDTFSLFVNFHVGRLVRDIQGLAGPDPEQPENGPVNILTLIKRQMEERQAAERKMAEGGLHSAEAAFFSQSA